MAPTVCPHCFERRSLKQLDMHCPVPCGKDAVQFAPADACPHGRPPQSARRCPGCGAALEYDYLHTQGRPIALIGATSSGKTTFVSVLVHELRNRVGADFDGMAVEFVGDLSRRRYDEHFGGPLYGRRELPAGTRRIAAEKDERLVPLLFTLKFPRRGLRALARNRVDPAMMVFFDTGGEDVTNHEEMERLARYLTFARGIVLVVDPLQIPGVGVRVPGDVPPNPMTEQAQVVSQLAARLRAEQRVSLSKRLSVPLAIALSKVDALDSMLADQSPLRRQHTHPGGYDEADGGHIHDDVRAWLHRWYGPEFDSVVARNFSNYRYFGFSALGLPPVGNAVDPAGIHPLRVEDPVLWLLAQFGHIAIARS